jgi:TIR domain
MRLYISYARPDWPKADSLAQRLRDSGHSVWVDTDLMGGQSWWDTILDRIRESDAFIAVLSRSSLKSGACQAERGYAARLGKPVLPIIIEPFRTETLPSDILQLQIVDYSQADETAAFRLLGAIMRLPSPQPLPVPLPEPPYVPSSPWANLVDQVGAPTLSLDQQLAIVARLEDALGPDSGPADRHTALGLLSQMERRTDLYAVVGRRIESLKQNTRNSPAWSSYPADPGPAQPSGYSGTSGSQQHKPDLSSRGIFLSYRREDAGPYARLLKSELSQRIPDARIFMDLDSIEAGLDFAEVIRGAVDSCVVLVALIGHQWATLLDEEGRRRLDNEDDYVRFEVHAALERGVRVIPVLVDGAKALREQQLPSELQKLARLNALKLSYDRYEYDAGKLSDVIKRVLANPDGDPQVL